MRSSSSAGYVGGSSLPRGTGCRLHWGPHSAPLSDLIHERGPPLNEEEDAAREPEQMNENAASSPSVYSASRRSTAPAAAMAPEYLSWRASSLNSFHN